MNRNDLIDVIKKEISYQGEDHNGPYISYVHEDSICIDGAIDIDTIADRIMEFNVREKEQ